MAAERWEALYPSGQKPNSATMAGDSSLNSNIPTSRVELSISCRGLRDLDIVSKSDPQVFIYIRDSYHDKYHEVGRTEMIRDTVNPDFVKKVILNYNFEMVQKIRFEVWDIDPVGKDFLGGMDTTLADIVSFKGRQFIKPLIGKNRNLNCGLMIIVCEEVVANKQILSLQFNAHDVRKGFMNHKRDTFLQIYKSNEDSNYSVVHKSEVFRNSSKPSFKAVNLKVSTLCNGDLDRSIRIDLMKWRLNGDHRLLGSVFTTVNAMIKSSPEDNKYPLVKKAGDKKKRGRLELMSCKLTEEVSFLDYIKGGTELHFAVAIDFTASNGVVSDPKSLHFMTESYPNSYEIALKSIAEIISHYDPKSMYASFGFGAIVPPDKVPSHHFPLNGNPAHPYCNGVNDLINCYKNMLSKVILYGPTNFAPVILATAEIARHNQIGMNYFILLIITDGIICDMDQTKKAIVRSSDLPLSIIIVGVGNADFRAMDELDSDDGLLQSSDGKKARRDIVQFVPLNRFISHGNHVHSMVDLAREVLYEVPDQIISYMRLKGFTPKKPSSDGPTAPSFSYNFN